MSAETPPENPPEKPDYLQFLRSAPRTANCPECGRFMTKIKLISVIRIYHDGGGLRSHICAHEEYNFLTHEWKHHDVNDPKPV
jgi:hypothetical protein